MKPRYTIVGTAALLALAQWPLGVAAQAATAAAPTAAAPAKPATKAPNAEEPQRHFTAAIEDYAKKDYNAAATEVRKAASYVRLEAARATGDVKQSLDAADTGLDQVARSLEQGAVTSKQQLDQAFAKASHALALTHRAQAAEDWLHKDYRAAGYQLKAAAHDLESAAASTGDEAKNAASTVVDGTRAVGDKLVSGAKWTRDEVAKGFESLGNALDRLGHDIGANTKAAPLGRQAG